MTAKPPAFQLYCNDWLASPTIIAMTPMEELAYFRMLLFMWQSGECSIPNDAELMARLTRTDFNTCSIVFKQAMIEHPKNKSKLTNKRLFDMWQERIEFVKSRSAAGKKSAKARTGKGVRTLDEHNSTRVQLCSNENEQVCNSSSSLEDEGDFFSESQNRSVDQFAVFWNVYPRKVAKGQAVRAWKTAMKKTSAEEVIEAAKKYARQQSGVDRQYIANPATWLNGERWADEDSKPTAGGYLWGMDWNDPAQRAEIEARVAKEIRG